MELEEYKEVVRLRREDVSRRFSEAMGGRQRFTLEIGCGHGHWLSAYGLNHPEEFCIGIDLMMRRVNRGDQKRSRLGVDNVVFLQGSAEDLVAVMPPDTKAEKVFILFPDPWPKLRHHKNRLIQPEFLSQLASVCVEGAPLHFRTDFEPYYEWTCEHLKEHPDWEISPETVWPFEHETIFQQRMGKYQSVIAKKV